MSHEGWLVQLAFCSLLLAVILACKVVYDISKWLNGWLDHRSGADLDPLYLEYKEWMRDNITFGMDFWYWKEHIYPRLRRLR